MNVVVIGAGIGGLAAALRVAAGHNVTILEARSDAGGLAGVVEIDGQRFDAGPYVLLDRPGLEWALAQLGIDVTRLELQRLDDIVYEVTWPERGARLAIYADVDRTAAQLGADADRYRRFVAAMAHRYARLAPQLRLSRPSPLRALSSLPFLLKSLGTVMRESGLPPHMVEALTIWTHVAGQTLRDAPSPMAFVPALIHTHGAWLPRGGTRAVGELLRDEAKARGVGIRHGVRVASIESRDRVVRGVLTSDGERIAADAVISNHSAVGTYVDLLDATPARTREMLRAWPLQSPGACAYLRVRTPQAAPYLRFRLGGALACRLLVTTGDTARLILPIPYEQAHRGEELLDQALAELDGVDVLLRRTPSQWGSEYTLYRDSMNPAMTAALMRRGRIAHRSPHARGLYLAGSSTHPGQWISFCAISGVLAGDALLAESS